jgi:hypothetical protein
MTRTLLASALFFLTFAADAQVLNHDNRRRDRDYRNDPYYGDDDRTRRRDRQRDRRNTDYGYGRAGAGYRGDPAGIASGVMSDVRTVASNNYGIGKHDREHFEKVQNELGDFTRKYRQDGKIDRGNLDDAAENLEHLVQSDQIRSSRDRRILSDALNAVRGLRSGRYTDRSYGGSGSIWDVFR